MKEGFNWNQVCGTHDIEGRPKCVECMIVEDCWSFSPDKAITKQEADSDLIMCAYCHKRIKRSIGELLMRKPLDPHSHQEKTQGQLTQAIANRLHHVGE